MSAVKASAGVEGIFHNAEDGESEGRKVDERRKKIEIQNKLVNERCYCTYTLNSSGSVWMLEEAILKTLLGRERAAAIITASDWRSKVTPYETNRPSVRSIGRRPAT